MAAFLAIPWCSSGNSFAKRSGFASVSSESGAVRLPGHRGQVEQHQRVVQLRNVRPRSFATAGDIEHQPEHFPAYVFDRRLAVGNASGVDIPSDPASVAPDRCAWPAFDHRHLCQTVKACRGRGEDMQVHSAASLQRAADEVAGRRGSIDQTLADVAIGQPLARRQHAGDGAVPLLTMEPWPSRRCSMIPPFYCPAWWWRFAVHAALVEIGVVPDHFPRSWLPATSGLAARAG